MRLIPVFVLLALSSTASLAAESPITSDRITELASAAAGGTTQVMTLLLERDDLKKGHFQNAVAFCRDEKLTMAIGGPDAELLHTFLQRELKTTGKRRAQGLQLVVVGPGEEDARLRPLLESYGVKFLYARGDAPAKKGA